MREASYWRHDEWKHEDERRFKVTLVVSAVLHALILLTWKIPPQMRNAVDSTVLTVVLRGTSSSATVSVTQRDQEKRPDDEPPVLGLKAPEPVVLPSQRYATSMAPIATKSGTTGDAGRLAKQATPGAVVNVPPRPAGVTVMLVIGGDGRVNEIYWSTLPALTDEQLRRVERAIRGRAYMPGQTVTEVFDVREFLKLPPVRVEDPAPQAEATVGAMEDHR